MPDNPTGVFPSDIWRQFLETPGEPQQAAYYAYQPQWGGTRQQKYYQGQFANVQNEYLGKLGQQILGGGAPTLNFTDFLSQVPWTQRYAQMPPSMRGFSASQFNPYTRRVFS